MYCGSNVGDAAVFAEAARATGRLLAQRGIGLVYGGGRVGLMGVVADGALEAGGEVIGVIPEKLAALELGHDGLTELIVVDSMHARKLAMARLSDAFIALPGGFGTLEELFEATTWTQLAYHHKPVGVLNVDGYFDPLLAFLDRARDRGFIREIHRPLISADRDAGALLAQLERVTLPGLHKWLQRP